MCFVIIGVEVLIWIHDSRLFSSLLSRYKYSAIRVLVHRMNRSPKQRPTDGLKNVGLTSMVDKHIESLKNASWMRKTRWPASKKLTKN
jgi:hypothetical protein